MATEIWSADTQTDPLSCDDYSAAQDNWRNIILNGYITDDATKIQLTFKAHSSNNGYIDHCTIGLRDTENGEDFDGAPTVVTFDSGNIYCTLTAGGTKVSDEITFTIDKTRDYLVHLWTDDGEGHGVEWKTWNPGGGEHGSGVDAGYYLMNDTTNYATTQDWTPTSSWDVISALEKIEKVEAGYTIDAEAGSYALGGQTTNLLKGSLIDVGAGAYVETGQVASLLKSSLIDIGAGSYIETGKIAGLLKSSLIDIGAGNYTETGQIVDLLKSSVISAGTGSFILTGQVVDLLKSSLIDIGSGTYILTGFAVTLSYFTGYIVEAEAGVYVLVGMDVDLDYTVPIYPIIFDVMPRERIFKLVARERIHDVMPRERIFDKSNKRSN